jgi:hypothetical protein
VRAGQPSDPGAEPREQPLLGDKVVGLAGFSVQCRSVGYVVQQRRDQEPVIAGAGNAGAGGGLGGVVELVDQVLWSPNVPPTPSADCPGNGRS